VGSPNSETAPNDVRYLRQFGEYILTKRFTARDPFRKLMVGFSSPSTSQNTTFDPEFGSLRVSLGPIIQRQGVTDTVKCLPERMFGIGFEIYHFDHHAIGSVSAVRAELCADSPS